MKQGELTERLLAVVETVNARVTGNPWDEREALEFVERAVFEALARRPERSAAPAVLELGTFVDQLVTLARALGPSRLADVHMTFSSAAALSGAGGMKCVLSLFVNGWKRAEAESVSARSVFTMLAAELHGEVIDQARALDRAADEFCNAAASR